MPSCLTCGKEFTQPTKNKNQQHCNNFCYRTRGRRTASSTEVKLSKAESVFKNMVQKEAKSIYHKGMPDFLIDTGNELKFVEVKSSTDRFRREQIEVMDILTKYGVSCFVAYKGRKLIPWKEIRPSISHLRPTMGSTMRRYRKHINEKTPKN